ncbi:tryptophan--tRNA ligase [Candidatus Pacearchaeota archaeon RBG_13_36_9]|nr:MAG: tryptophan--tRNA ligase [Candidatus Pacearchaeota archaeon RBG_13_36_9]
MKNQVTPWEVKGEVDYGKLIKEFGLEKIDKKLLERIKKNAGEVHFMLRRGVFFAHRDMNWLLDEYEKGNKFFLYTGCGPSGPIHLGHLQTWYFTKWLQDKFDCELWFQFTDDEKFLFKDKSYKEIQDWMYENMLDIIAVGFNPKKTHFLIDTKHAGLIYPEAIKVAKKITFSMVKSSFGFNESNNIGEIFFTSVQAVPAFLPSVLEKKEIPCLIPHAVDQDPHFRLTRDILPKLGHYRPASIQCPFLPPLTGNEGKMSSSESAKAILSTDNEKTVAAKINKYAFSGGKDTIEEHRKKGGNPDIDVSFQYLRMMLEDNDEKLAEIYRDYKSGKMLTSELKQITIEKLNFALKRHQQEREKARKQIDKFISI